MARRRRHKNRLPSHLIDLDGRVELRRSAMPECIGHYAQGDEQCDGKPCAYREVCIPYRALIAQKAQILSEIVGHPVQTDAMLFAEWQANGKTGVFRNVRNVWLRRAKPLYMKRAKKEFHAFQWGIFLWEFARQLPDVQVAPNRGSAEMGDVYHTRIDTQSGGYYELAVKGFSETEDVRLIRYRVRKSAGWRAEIEIRVPLRKLMKAYPSLHDKPERWLAGVGAHGAKMARIGATALEVQPEHHATFARVAVESLLTGLMPGVSYSGGRRLTLGDERHWKPWLKEVIDGKVPPPPRRKR